MGQAERRRPLSPRPPPQSKRGTLLGLRRPNEATPWPELEEGLEEVAEPEIAEWECWKVEISMVAHGKYGVSFQYKFGYDEPDPEAKEKAMALADQIMGIPEYPQGTTIGWWQSEGKETRLSRNQILCVTVNNYLRRAN